MTLMLVGAATSAWPMGRFMDYYGRRPGLALGQILGLFGALTGGFAVLNENLICFLVGLVLLGFARGALDMGRYAAAEANPPERRAQSISLVVLGGTTGALVGPCLMRLSTQLENVHGFRPMSVAWFMMAALLSLCFIIVFGFLRPDPANIAGALSTNGGPADSGAGKARSLNDILRDRRCVPAVGSILCGHLVMYLVMTVTPVFMHECHHDTVEISWVFFAHLLGMYGLSFAVGWLIDRFGRLTAIVSGSLILTIAVLLAPFDTGTLWLALVLFLVGLGWNCCFVSGSSLLSDLLRTGERGRIQGLVDTLVNATAALASLGSGLIYAHGGFPIANSLSLAIALIPCVLVWKFTSTFRRRLAKLEFIDSGVGKSPDTVGH